MLLLLLLLLKWEERPSIIFKTGVKDSFILHPTTSVTAAFQYHHKQSRYHDISTCIRPTITEERSHKTISIHIIHQSTTRKIPHRQSSNELTDQITKFLATHSSWCGEVRWVGDLGV